MSLPSSLPHPIPTNPLKSIPTHSLITRLFQISAQKSSNAEYSHTFNDNLPHSISFKEKRRLNALAWRFSYEKLLNLREYDIGIQSTDLDALKFEFGMHLQSNEWHRFELLHDHMIKSAITAYEPLLQLMYNLRDIAQKSGQNQIMSSFQHLTEFRERGPQEELAVQGNNQWFVPGQDNLSGITNRGKDTLFSNYVFSQKLTSTPLKEDVKIQHQGASIHDLVRNWFSASPARHGLTHKSDIVDSTLMPPPHAARNQHQPSQTHPSSTSDDSSSFSFFGKALRDAHNLMDLSSPYSSQMSLFMPPLSPAQPETPQHSRMMDDAPYPISPIRLTSNIEIDYAPEEPPVERVEPPFKKLIVSSSPDSQRFRRRVPRKQQALGEESPLLYNTPAHHSPLPHQPDPASTPSQQQLEMERKRSVLYLTELGKDTLDQVYNSYFVHSKNAPYDPITTTEEDLIDDAILVWQGIASETFRFRPAKCGFEPIYVRLHSTSVSSIRAVLNDIAWSGSLYRRLEVFCQYFMSPDFQHPHSSSIVCQAFSNSVFKFLKYYQSCIIKLGTIVKAVLQKEAYTDATNAKNSMTLWSISQHVRPLVAKLHYVAQLCHCDVRPEHDLSDSYTEEIQGLFGGTLRVSERLSQFPRGAKLLSYLHYMSLTSADSTKSLLLTFFKDASSPYLKWLQDWIYHGTVDENNHEFLVRKTRAYNLDVQQYESATSFWTAAFGLYEENIPSFLSSVADAILSVGRVLNVIRKYDPTHYILKSRAILDPKLVIRFSNGEIRHLRADYLRLSIFQKAEHQHHVQQRVTREMEELEAMKEKSQWMQDRIQKQQNELVALARQQAEARQRLLEERIAEIEAKRQQDRDAAQHEEQLERDREAAEVREQQRLIELAKQRILEEHSAQIRQLEKQRSLIEWKHERHNLNALRQNKLLLLQNRYNQMRLAQELGMSIEQLTIHSPGTGTLTRSWSSPKALRHSNTLTSVNAQDADAMHDVDDGTPSHIEPKLAEETATPPQQLEHDADVVMAEEPMQTLNDIETVETTPLQNADDIISRSNIVISVNDADDAMEVATQMVSSEVEHSPTGEDTQFQDEVTLRKRQSTTPGAGVLVTPTKTPSLQRDMEREYYELFAQDVSDEFSGNNQGNFTDQRPQNDSQRSVTFENTHSDLPIDQAVEESLYKPIIVQYNAAHSIVLSVFFGELHLEDHLELMRKFFLMRAGDFSEMFFRRIIDGLHEGNRWTDVHQLNTVLESTLKLTEYYEDDNLCHNLSFRVPPLDPHKPIDIHGIDALKHISLKYNVGWPLNILIDGDALNKYNQIFHFLAQVKRVMIELNDTWTHFTHRTVRQSFDTRIREIQMFRQEIQHFMNIMQSYLMTEVLETLFSDFLHRIKTEAKTVERLVYLHQEFLNTAIRRCLLSTAAKPVKKVIDRMFAVILQFRLQILSNPLNLNLPHGAYMMMKQSRYQFRELQMEFIHILKKKDLHEDQTQLLTTLNFNNHYFEM